jgi:hypothetical protein
MAECGTGRLEAEFEDAHMSLSRFSTGLALNGIADAV